MEFETICRYRLPVTVVILNNGGVYRGDEQASDGADPAPTVLSTRAHHELLAKAFGGNGFHVTTPAELKSALSDALASRQPAIIDCQLDPAAGVESGHLTSLNPKSAAKPQFSAGA
jgi:oxalyl-CoA decarboxylase